MTPDHRLQAFLSYINNYLHTYRKRYNKTASDPIVLRFLVGNTDTINIHCALSEPLDTSFKVNDFWYSGSVLRKCVSVEPDEQVGVIRQYKVCYKYADAFSSTILSLNPSLDGSSSLPPTVTQNPPTNPNPGGVGDAILSGGGTMSGPLYLRERILDAREAVPKSYVDALHVNHQQILSQMSALVQNAASQAQQAVTAMAQLRTDLKDVLALQVIRVSKTTPAKEWPVVHNHGSRFVIVQAYDTTGEKIEPDVIRVVNENAVKLEFAVPVAGRAVVFLPKE